MLDKYSITKVCTKLLASSVSKYFFKKIKKRTKQKKNNVIGTHMLAQHMDTYTKGIQNKK